MLCDDRKEEEIYMYGLFISIYIYMYVYMCIHMFIWDIYKFHKYRYTYRINLKF